VANSKASDADVTVAETLSDKNLTALKDRTEIGDGKDVALNVNVDPSDSSAALSSSWAAGWDSSLRTKLNSIKHAMKEAG